MKEHDRLLPCVGVDMRHTLLRLVGLVVIAGLLLGTPAQAAVTFKRGNLTITQGPTKVTLAVDVADTPPSRERGLGFRESLAEDAGMVFVYEDIGLETFWMSNVLIPLSVAFMRDRGDQPYLHNQQWEIVDIVDMSVAPDPHSGPFQVYKSARPYRYALEVNQGFFQRHNLTVGATVQYTPR